MKSIMHQASSLAKAIEQGWEKAGKPADFTVKILEQPQKNFFGLTTHPAKIAIYFDERPARTEVHGARHPKQGRERTERIDRRPVAASPVQQRQVTSRPARRPAEEVAPRRSEESIHEQEARHERHESREAAQARTEVQWTEPMMAYVREWLGYVLPETTGKQVQFTVEPSNAYLRITFESTVLENREKEKRLFASLSLLILEALKRKFRSGLRRHKIILTNQ